MRRDCLLIKQGSHCLDENIGTLLTWSLHALTLHPDVQDTLREELRQAGIDSTSTLKDVHALPYLDVLTKECMRLYTPALMVTREADVDTVIPFAKPLADGSRGGQGFFPVPLRCPRAALFVSAALEVGEFPVVLARGEEDVTGAYGHDV